MLVFQSKLPENFGHVFDLIANDMRASFKNEPDFMPYNAVQPKQSLSVSAHRQVVSARQPHYTGADNRVIEFSLRHIDLCCA
ncbi:MAG TPA: hypothetical protein VJZ77_00855 [Blastocatellia bacterium]|nr:hypothetical protein [Blastocatellia bacterium]